MIIEGVIGSKSHHFTPINEKDKIIPIDNLYIDIGCSSYKEVVSLGIDIGCVATYSKKFIENGPIVFSPTLDNRVGCLILLKLIEKLLTKKYNVQLFFVASVQEEFNLRGVLPAARKINPDFAICIDCVVACDTPDLDKTDVKLGKGPVISLYSFHGRGTLGGTIPNKKLRTLVNDSFLKSNISFQKSVSYGSLTDASFIQIENEGIPAIEIGFPTRYTHSPLECCNIEDINKLLIMMELLIMSLPSKIDISYY